MIRSIEDIRFMDSSDPVYLSQDTLNDPVVYETKDIPDPTSPYIPKSFVIALRDYISGVQPSAISHPQERIRDFKNTIAFGTLSTEDCSRQVSFYDCTQDSFRSSQLTIDSDEEFEDKMDTDDDHDYDSLSDFSDINDNDFYIDENVKVSEMIQDFDLLISPAITNYQMSRTTWATCSTMIFIVICVMIVLLRNVWLIFFGGVTRTRRVVVKFRFIHALINIFSHTLISLSCTTIYFGYLNGILTSSISIANVINNLSFFDKFVTSTKSYYNNSFKKVLIWPLLIVIMSFFVFCAYDHSSDDRPFGKQVYVEKYMPISKDYKPVTPVVLPEEDYTYDKIYSHFRGVLDCRFISIEHSRAVKGYIVDADCDY
ncbi:hypothetical protein F8M41_019983 [Gigaspora margarita]|uniref:Uncharacterized protein n=1 Tax=Gigaspora margarita TaxID=4874 RepID=A0A8H4AJ89_GIGMA|nr:hypothetical protein F8M41_019983 [Gigaspora margarita]